MAGVEKETDATDALDQRPLEGYMRAHQRAKRFDEREPSFRSAAFSLAHCC